MKDLISNEANERLIKVNEDCSSDVGAVAVRQHLQESIRQSALMIIVDNFIQTINSFAGEESVA